MLQKNLTGSLPHSVSGYLSFFLLLNHLCVSVSNTLYLSHMEHVPASKILLPALCILLVALPMGFSCYSLCFFRKMEVFSHYASCGLVENQNKTNTDLSDKLAQSCWCSMNPTTLARFLRNFLFFAKIPDDAQCRKICPTL